MPILIHIDKVKGDVRLKGYEGKDYFVADSFSFGVEREMKESGDKGGTEDLNIGIGQLQECSIGKSMDTASTLLAQAAINGNSLGSAVIDFAEVGAGELDVQGGLPLCYLRFQLDRCFVKSWTISGDADDRPTEEVQFYYNRIAFSYCATEDGKVFSQKGEMSWDNVTGTKWDVREVNKIVLAGQTGFKLPINMS